MNKSILLMPVFIAGLAKSQQGTIGINTASPKTTLDVNGKTDTNGFSLAGDITGLQAPRLTRAELTNKGNTLYGTDQRGAIVYITDVSGGNNASQRVNITSVGYYYFDGTVWNRIASNSGALLNPVTSDNGLTKTGDNIQLGGALIKNTDIATAGFNTTFSGTGNVGIGTTLPTQKLEVVGNGKFVSSNNLVEAVVNNTSSPGLNLIRNGTSNLNNNNLMGFMNFGGRINNTDNQAVATIVGAYKGNGTNNLSSLEFRTSGTIDTDMILSESGDLGLGTGISPTQKLDVDGNVRFRQVPENTSINTNDRVMVLDNTGVAKKVLLSSVQSTVTSDNGLTKTGNNVQLGGTLLKNTDIATAGFNTTFSGAGNLGLGVVPTKKLDVDGDTYLRGKLNLAAAYDDGATLIVKNKIPGNWIASFAGSGTNDYRLILMDNGNMGVGNVPTKKLDVNGDAILRGRLNVSADYEDGATLIVKNNIPGNWIASFAGSGTNDYRLVLFDNGNLGVGTITPSERLEVNGKVKINNTALLADTNAKPLFVSSNGVVGTLNEAGPKTLFMDALNATTNFTDNASSFNSGADIKLNFAASNVRLNTLGSTVNQNEIVIAESGFYQLSASLTTFLSAQAGNNIFQVFNVEKSSDSGATWSSISGLREIHNIPPGFSGSLLRFYIVTPSVVVQLQANDRIRLITFRPKAGDGSFLGNPVTSFSISGITQQGTRAYTLGLTKL